jgi:hypothetical protein
MSVSTAPSDPLWPHSHCRRVNLPGILSILPVVVVLLAIFPGHGVRAQERWQDFHWLQQAPGKLRIRAEKLVAKGKNGPVLLTGGVRVTGEHLDIRSEWMEIFPAQDRIVLAGSVRVIEDVTILLGDRVELDRKTSRLVIQHAVILVKQDVASEELPGYVTALDLIEAGNNAFSLRGDRVVREGNRYDVEGARFTACDCPGDETPSWEIRACRADVVPDERAWLTWPVFYAKGVPVLASPVAYLPLSNRTTGFLFPQVNYSGRDGFVLSESLFVTLGRSADTTLSADWFEERGFRERIEFRARPSAKSLVETRLMYMLDEKVADDDTRSHLKHRYSAELDAWAYGESGTSMNASVRLYSDSDINRDFMSEMAGRAADFAPSSLLVEQRGTHFLVSLDSLYKQDLRFPAVDLFGSQTDEPVRRQTHDTIHRLGAFSFYLAPVGPTGWPLSVSVFVEGANQSSLSQSWRDWGTDGTPNEKEPSYSDPVDAADRGADDGSGGEGDGVLGIGELRRAFRILLEPNVNFPIRLGRFLNIEAGFSHRQLAYLPHGPWAPGPSTRGITFAHLGVSTELSRAWGDGNAPIGHVITPWVVAVGAWRGFESDDPLAYLDVQDRLLEDAQQFVVGIDTGLYGRKGISGFSRFLGLSVMQGVDLQGERLAQGTVEMDLNLPPFSGRGLISVDWSEPALAEADLTLRFADRRADRISLSYLYLPSVRDNAGRPLPLSQRVGKDPGLMFVSGNDYYRAMGESVHILQATAGIPIAWGLSLNGGVSLDLREVAVPWYGGGIGYQSDCRCWGFSLTVRMLQGQDIPDVFFLLDLAYLGAAGVGTNARF